MRNLVREVGFKTYSASGQETLSMPRDYAYIDIMIELYAKITVASGNTSGTLRDLAPAQLLRHLELRANGRDVIKSLDFESLSRLTHIRYGTAPNNTLLVNGDAQTNTECYVYAILPLAMWRSVKPFDTLFNAKPLSTLELIMTFGTIADIYCDDAPGNRTSSVVEARVYIASKESVGLEANAVLPLNKEALIESEVTATSTEHKIQLNYAKDLAYRCLVLKAMEYNCVRNTVVNDIQLKSGGVIFYRLAGRRTRARNKSIFAVETMPTGYYVIDFCEDGRLADSLDTSGLSSLDLVLDVTKLTGTTKIRVYTTEVIVPTVVS